MANGSFKSDESFLQKLAVGAAGTKATIGRLTEMGFRPIELERGSSGFKIWKRIKIKRVRVPDILCLKSGLRFESRGKTKLEISMSHSRSDPNRAWDVGLAANDYVVVLLCEQASDSIVDWQPVSPAHFVRVEDMQSAFERKHVKITQPKGVEEGSEIRVIWPSAKANEQSEIVQVTHTAIRLQATLGGRGQLCKLARREPLTPLCQLGDTVVRNQIVAAVVPVTLQLTCSEDIGEAYFRDKLSSPVLSERYAAAKALRFRGYQEAATCVLKSCLQNEMEDIYVRLEAAAALAAQDDPVGWEFLKMSLASQFDQVQLETVIVLSEIKKPASQTMLVATLADRSRHEEIRAGAAWALGEFQNPDSSHALVSVFDETSLHVKIEAARALLRLVPDQVPLLVELLKQSSQDRRDGLAWVLARQGRFDPAELVENRPDDNLRRWAAYILGYGKENFLEETIRQVCKSDPEVYFSASVLWQLLASWIYGLKEY